MTVPDQYPQVVRELRAAGCVFAEDEASLLIEAASTRAALAELVRQRVAGRPLEVILGWAEFCGLRVEVAAGVFVPRRRSEFLVAQAVSIGRPGAVVLDLCCGSGALGIAVRAGLGAVELHATDLEPAAVRCARRNVEPVGGRVYQGDLFQPLPAGLRGRVELLLANAPYVPTDEIAYLPAEARGYEPRTALDGGPDGLGVQRRLIAEAAHWLAPGGSVLIESSRRQVPLTRRCLLEHGLAVEVRADEALDATVLIGTLPAEPGGGQH